MDDLISRQAAIEIVGGYMNRLAKHIGTPTDKERYSYARGVLLGVEIDINALPSAQKTGRWIPVTNGRGGSECNLCHAYAPTYQSGAEYNSPYCPNCGAKMEDDNGKTET